MNEYGICGNGATCEQVCPIKMVGRLCPDLDMLAEQLNIVWGLTPAQLQAVGVAA